MTFTTCGPLAPITGGHDTVDLVAGVETADPRSATLTNFPAVAIVRAVLTHHVRVGSFADHAHTHAPSAEKFFAYERAIHASPNIERAFIERLDLAAVVFDVKVQAPQVPGRHGRPLESHAVERDPVVELFIGPFGARRQPDVDSLDAIHEFFHVVDGGLFEFGDVVKSSSEGNDALSLPASRHTRDTHISAARVGTSSIFERITHARSAATSKLPAMPSELAARGEVKRPPRRRGLFSFWVRGSAGLVHVVDKSRVRLIPSRRRRRSVAAPSSHHAAPVAARRSIARVRFDTPRDARPHRSPRRASVRLPLGRVRTIDRVVDRE
eukprot:30967-Pelagococcus_subviridis.AAC.16